MKAIGQVPRAGHARWDRHSWCRELPLFGRGGWGRLLWLAMAIGFAGGFLVRAETSLEGDAAPVRVERATDVVRVWRSDRHLYVKGQLGVGEEQLRALAAWLATQATNWTVVLAESVEDERYTDAGGHSFSRLDAVEHALGKGLPNQTAFGQLVDARTGQANGAFFLLSLKERKLSYYGSEAQDRRGLGEDRWAGNLDKPAIAAMRSGGRVIDAAKDTIQSIDGRLTQAIEREQTERERRAAAQAAERERRVAAERAERALAIERGRAELQAAEEALARVERELAAWRTRQPNASDDLLRPELALWQGELKAARADFEERGDSAARNVAESVKQRAERWLRLAAAHQEAVGKIDGLGRALEELGTHPLQARVQTSLVEARAALARARTAGEQGSPGCAEGVKKVEATIAHVRQELAMIERYEAVARRQRLVVGTGALVLLSLLGVGLNWRRRPTRRECLALLRIWETGLGEKTLALFELRDRVATVLGASAEENAQRYSGQTRELGARVIQSADELFLMSACAGRILQQSQALAEPADFWPRVVNVFSRRRYRAGLRRLRDELIAFRPEEGVELVVRGPRGEQDRLLGNVASYQPFTLSFSELVDTFNERARQALADLEAVEQSLISVGGTLEQLQRDLAALEARAAAARAAAADGWFGLAALLEQALPAARASLADGVKIALSDAVSALRVHGAKARRLVADGAALVDAVERYRQQVLPGVLKAAETLRGAGVDSAWVQRTLVSLSETAEQVALFSLEQSAAERLAALTRDLSGLAERCEQAVLLEAREREKEQPASEEATALIESSRVALGAALGVASERVLVEAGEDPSRRVVDAREQRVSARASLARGDVEAARGALDHAAALLQEARTIVERTREAVQGYAERLKAARDESGRLALAIPAAETTLRGIEREFEASVLVLGQGDPTHPQANGTVADNVDEASQHLAEGRRLLGEAETAQRQAQVLRAAESLRQAEARHETANHRLAEIAEKRARIDAAEASNRQRCQALEGRVRELAAPMDDPRTRAATREMFARLRGQVEEVRGQLGRARRDPFATESLLAELEGAAQSAADRWRCDHDLHAQAERSLRAAGEQLETAGGWARRAATDDVADSPAITQARLALEDLGRALTVARQRWQSPHEDWAVVDAEAARVAAEAGRQSATLQGELREAEAAVQALLAGATAVRQAGGWTGLLGVAILGCPGADVLGRAQALLRGGDYRSARSAADTARQVALQAIAAAEAEVRRRQREEEERLERERRRRAEEERARHRAMQHSSSSSWGHSGSGTSRSSFSSGSGVGRSGW